MLPKQLNNSAPITFDSNDWFIPKPLEISAMVQHIEDRLRDTHELVQYENITNPDNPSDIINTIAFRNRRVYTGDTSRVEKIQVDDSELDNTGYHPAVIRFDVESCDEDYSGLSINQTEKIEVIDAELPDESLEV